MLKKIVTVAIATFIVTVLYSASAPSAAAQVYCNECCDSSGPRCYLTNPLLCNSGCFCYGLLGSGYAC
jgi:hypothetical protein